MWPKMQIQWHFQLLGSGIEVGLMKKSQMAGARFLLRG